MNSNYYTRQIDRALEGHDNTYAINLQLKGTKQNSHNISCPMELVNIIKKWYADNKKGG